MQPGWYDDPWSAAALRWWDGYQWTPADRPRPPEGSVQLLSDVVAKTAKAQLRWKRWARVSLMIWYGLLIAAGIGVTIALVGFRLDLFHDSTKSFPDSSPVPVAAPSPSTSSDSGSNLVVNLGVNVLSYLPVLAQFPFLWWLYLSGTLGDRLRLPASRNPVWGIAGFFVPIINFWFPYQVARDLFPPGDPQRRIVRWWWVCYLVASTLFVPMVIVGFLAPIEATIVLGLVEVTAGVLAMYYGLRMITAATATQQHLAGFA